MWIDGLFSVAALIIIGPLLMLGPAAVFVLVIGRMIFRADMPLVMRYAVLIGSGCVAAFFWLRYGMPLIF